LYLFGEKELTQKNIIKTKPWKKLEFKSNNKHINTISGLPEYATMATNTLFASNFDTKDTPENQRSIKENTFLNDFNEIRKNRKVNDPEYLNDIADFLTNNETVVASYIENILQSQLDKIFLIWHPDGNFALDEFTASELKIVKSNGRKLNIYVDGSHVRIGIFTDNGYGTHQFTSNEKMTGFTMNFHSKRASDFTCRKIVDVEKFVKNNT
jgi:hypothetical protein